MMLLTNCNIFEGIVSCVESICAVLNIVLLVYFTIREWNNAKDREAQDRKEHLQVEKLNRQKIWYDKIVIERIVDQILELFSEICVQIDKGVKENKNEIVNEVNEILAKYKRIIAPCLKMFSDDLAREVNRKLQDYQDKILTEISKKNSINRYIIERYSNEYKATILQIIYKYDFQNNLEQE